MNHSKNILPGPTVPAASAQHHTVDQLVINWHLTEACNYSCRYCYSSWEKGCDAGELFHDEVEVRTLLSELKRFFSPDNHLNPLSEQLRWRKLRLSLAGGEPLLHQDRAASIVEEARRQGFDVSLITNASSLENGACTPLLENISMLGVSLDSADEWVCREIGRADRSGQVLNLRDLATTLERTRSLNPKISIKINTVVNQLNCEEDLSGLIETLSPDKWKVLRVLPVLGDELVVSQGQYESFLRRHQHLRNVMSTEDNHEMAESYLMVDPHGRFFQNGSSRDNGEGSYLYSSPILQVGAEKAFRQINFNAQKFASRYPRCTQEVAA